MFTFINNKIYLFSKHIKYIKFNLYYNRKRQENPKQKK